MATGSFRRIIKRTLAGINVLISLLFLLGCYSSWFDPEKYWLTGLATLSAFYLLLLLIAFMVFWLFSKPSLMAIGILTLLLAWQPMKHLFKLRLTPQFTMKRGKESLRVMSWNVEHFDILEHKTRPQGKYEMINLVNSYTPDIACFQEMVGSDNIPSAINYVPDFMKRLNMADCYYSYNHKLDFDNDHHFGLIIFSRFPVINKKTVGYPPYDYNSIFQYIDIVKETDTFRVFNIHLQSLKFSDRNKQYIEDPTMKDEADIENSKNILSKFKRGFLKRSIQSNRIREEMNNSPYPVIICGDFNDVPNSYAYSRIGDGMKNAFTEKGAGIGRTYFGISPTLRIDNIFADQRFTVEQYIRIQKKLSDHFPIIADLYFKKQ